MLMTVRVMMIVNFVKVAIRTVKLVIIMNNRYDDNGDDATGGRNLLASSTWLGARHERAAAFLGRDLEPDQIFQHDRSM